MGPSGRICCVGVLLRCDIVLVAITVVDAAVQIVEGLSWPAFSIVLSELLGVLINPDGESEVNKWCLAFVIVGLISFARYHGTMISIYVYFYIS